MASRVPARPAGGGATYGCSLKCSSASTVLVRGSIPPGPVSRAPSVAASGGWRRRATPPPVPPARAPAAPTLRKAGWSATSGVPGARGQASPTKRRWPHSEARPQPHPRWLAVCPGRGAGSGAPSAVRVLRWHGARPLRPDLSARDLSGVRGQRVDRHARACRVVPILPGDRRLPGLPSHLHRLCRRRDDQRAPLGRALPAVRWHGASRRRGPLPLAG
jgi:hypothetical protein